MRHKHTRIYFILFIFVGLFMAGCGRAGAQDVFEDYLWEKRVVVVFSPSMDHPDFVKQVADFKAARDVVYWQIVHLEMVSVDGALQPHLSTNAFYKRLNVGRDDFAVILIGKDGGEKLRQNTFVSSEILFNTIDAMPMRQREMRGE